MNFLVNIAAEASERLFGNELGGPDLSHLMFTNPQ